MLLYVQRSLQCPGVMVSGVWRFKTELQPTTHTSNYIYVCRTVQVWNFSGWTEIALQIICWVEGQYYWRCNLNTFLLRLLYVAYLYFGFLFSPVYCPNLIIFLFLAWSGGDCPKPVWSNQRQTTGNYWQKQGSLSYPYQTHWPSRKAGQTWLVLLHD